MSQPPYRTLQVSLRIFSALLAVGALFMILGSRGLVARCSCTLPSQRFRRCCSSG